MCRWPWLSKDQYDGDGDDADDDENGSRENIGGKYGNIQAVFALPSIFQMTLNDVEDVTNLPTGGEQSTSTAAINTVHISPIQKKDLVKLNCSCIKILVNVFSYYCCCWFTCTFS